MRKILRFTCALAVRLRRFVSGGVAVWGMMLMAASAVHAAGPMLSAMLGGSGEDYALAVTADAQGNVYVAGLTYSPDFPVTPGAFQTKFGQTSDAFVAKLGPDGKLIWCTYLGGILDDWATGIALDGAGNVLVAGWTRSADFPVTPGAVQGKWNFGGFDAFVAKLDPTGSKLLYATFLGGPRDDWAVGLAADTAGNAYVAMTTQSAAGIPGVTATADNQFGIVVTKLNPSGALVYSYFHPTGSAGGIAVDGAGSAYVTGTGYAATPVSATKSFGPAGASEALVFKLSPDGKQKIYETTLGGSVAATGAAIAVNSAGEVYIAGSTASVDFPLVNPIQKTLGARPLWKSADGGATWTPIDDLPFALPRTLVADPRSPDTLYVGTADLGIFKSVDGGVTWAKANRGIVVTGFRALSIDQAHPQTLYAAFTSAANPDATTVYKSVDGASSWTIVDTAPTGVSQITVDAQNPGIVYEAGSGSAIRKSTDGGSTWATVVFPALLHALALDPQVSGVIVASSNLLFSSMGHGQNPYFFRSVDGGANWTQSTVLAPTSGGIIADGTTSPTTFYAGQGMRSSDGGITWTPLTSFPVPGNPSTALALDPSGRLYAAVNGQNVVYVSRDHAQSWTAAGPAVARPSFVSLVAAGAAGTLYGLPESSLNGGFEFGASTQSGTAGFVAKLSADGASLLYSTYLRGHPVVEPITYYVAEPNVFLSPNWISGIVVDAAGNATVAGGTRAVDFPVASPARASNAGLADIFVATISADGRALNYATYFGGSQDEGALAVALDPQGNVVIAGQSFSFDFPKQGGALPGTGFGEAFVTKFAPPGPPAVTAVLNGASFLPGIEAGSWVTIEGTNLANTFPGRKWRDEEVAGGNLPASLDGVSVTIDGKPAFVYYISPTQINVQAPSDSTTGSVAVVVSNNGTASVPATAQLQPAAPGLFVYGATNYAIASRLPDYALIGDSSAVPGTVAAKPGDLVVLWGTGFGTTDPSTPAGVAVSGAPAVVTTPRVTVGGVDATVISAVLTTGAAGLYQVTIRIPDTVPAGAAAVRASVGGAQTQSGAMLFVAK